MFPGHNYSSTQKRDRTLCCCVLSFLPRTFRNRSSVGLGDVHSPAWLGLAFALLGCALRWGV